MSIKLITMTGSTLAVKLRQAIEREIAKAFITSALSAGYAISVHDGEERLREGLGDYTCPACLGVYGANQCTCTNHRDGVLDALRLAEEIAKREYNDKGFHHFYRDAALSIAIAIRAERKKLEGEDATNTAR